MMNPNRIKNNLTPALWSNKVHIQCRQKAWNLTDIQKPIQAKIVSFWKFKFNNLTSQKWRISRMAVLSWSWSSGILYGNDLKKKMNNWNKTLPDNLFLRLIFITDRVDSNFRCIQNSTNGWFAFHTTDGSQTSILTSKYWEKISCAVICREFNFTIFPWRMTIALKIMGYYGSKNEKIMANYLYMYMYAFCT